MELINSQKFISSKVEKIKEQIKFENEIYKVDVVLLDQKKNQKIQKFINNQNYELYLKEIASKDINEEINKRIVRAMIKYNKKDYWNRREAIQTWRLNGTDDNATKILKETLHSLDILKLEEENRVKEKIKTRLSKVILSKPEERELKREEYLKAKEVAKIQLEEFKQNLDIKYNEILVKRKEKFDKKIASLEAKEKELVSKFKQVANSGYALPENIVLKVENLTMQFGGLKAVDDLSFEVKKGEVFGLIGPNGAGKTTVFNCITQFYKPTKGNLYFQEKLGNTISLTDYEVHNVIKKGIVRTFQNVEVIKEISVLDNLLVAAHTQYKSGLATQFLHLSKLKKEEKIIRAKAYEVLEFMGLSSYANWLAWGLPYGILKKIEIARTLMNNPQLIILDEPAAGLNDTETVELTKLIRKIQEKYNCTILLVEHDMGLVMDICDTICAISFGKLLALGSPAEIQRNKDVQAAYLGYVEEE